MTECQYAECDSSDTIVRESRGSQERYVYCKEHDPLEDPDVADLFRRPQP